MKKSDVFLSKSPIYGSINNIVPIGRSKSAMTRTQTSFQGFLNFMDVETKKIASIKLPKKKKIEEIGGFNVGSTFGRPGNLLSSVASGALDIAGLFGNMFGGGRKNPKVVPSKGPNIKFGGLKALGIANTIFAGLDFATGLAEGETVGKAASGAGGALAGGILGGVVGQALIPIPGLGFMVGSAAGNFLGGYLGDRTYEGITGTGGKNKNEDALAAQTTKQKEESKLEKTTFSGVLDEFSKVVTKFEDFAYASFSSMANAAATASSGEQNLEWGAEYPNSVTGSAISSGGELQSVKASGGKLPSSAIVTSGFGPRWGRMHQGVDYAGPGVDYEPISSIQPGTVSYAGSAGSAGNMVEVQHPNGDVTKYMHLQSIGVNTGQEIQPGTVLGVVGSTGRSTGPHLHFELWKNGQPINPESDADTYFRFGSGVSVSPTSASEVSAQTQPTAVLMAGTNDSDASSTAANVKKSIEELQSKGYRVVVVPPSQQTGSPYANIGSAVEQVAKESGVEVRSNVTYKGAGDPYPYAHLDSQSVQSLQNEFPNATFVGDSNAEPFANNMSYTGQSSAVILDAIKSLPNQGTNSPRLDTSLVKGIPRQSSTIPKQVNEYPSYDSQTTNTIILPMMSQGNQQRPMVISADNGSQQMAIPNGPSQGTMLNNLVKSLLLTNLSGS